MNYFTELKKSADVRWLKSAREIGRFVEAYIAELSINQADTPIKQSSLLLVAASAASPGAYAIATKAQKLEDCGVALRVIFADSANSKATHAFFAQVRGMTVHDCPSKSGRWAHNPRLHDAHEQLFLGDNRVWTGDTLRRAGVHSNAIDVFETNADHMVFFGRQAFEALWETSVAMRASCIRAPKEGRTGLTLGGAQAAMVAADGTLFISEDDGQIHLVH